MSLSYIVVCRIRPKLAPGDHSVGPLDVEAIARADCDTAWLVRNIPPRRRRELGDWTVHINCRSAAGEVAEAAAERIAARGGGGWIACDIDAKPWWVDAGSPGDPRDLLPELGRLVERKLEEIELREAERLAVAMEEWRRDGELDPKSHADANDWSHV